ncbi:hypothetical protein PROFUN_10430 [Planoprotostelium fungivorum]|uniref:Uncharacterized protein n=1 Tax=Planoprotostelium fungivorum TaxID=1890364 RepID=A0A2P6NDX3_9EUKA|nr:hypothetical protein PROFUN_10430 [Planoprotostelium fungivorum]
MSCIKFQVAPSCGCIYDHDVDHSRLAPCWESIFSVNRRPPPFLRQAFGIFTAYHVCCARASPA